MWLARITWYADIESTPSIGIVCGNKNELLIFTMINICNIIVCTIGYFNNCLHIFIILYYSMLIYSIYIIIHLNTFVGYGGCTCLSPLDLPLPSTSYSRDEQD